MQSGPTVFVVDDEAEVREILRRLFLSAGLSVETYASGEAFLEAACFNAPGCLVLDVSMPGMSGLELQRELAARGSRLPTIFLTGSADVPLAVEAMHAGAADFLEKTFDNAALLGRVRKVLALDSQNQSERLERAELEANRTLLTPREREVMKLIVSGKSSKMIGRILGVSPRTVDVHRARVMEKMRADSLADLVRRVLHLDKNA